MSSCGPLREQLRALPESPRLRGSGCIDLERVRALVQDHLAGRDCTKALWLTWVFDAFLAQRATVQLTEA